VVVGLVAVVMIVLVSVLVDVLVDVVILLVGHSPTCSQGGS